MKEGTAIITLPAGAFTNGTNNSNSASFKVTVTSSTTSVCSAPADITVEVGKTKVVTFSCTNVKATGSATVSSGNTSIATATAGTKNVSTGLIATTIKGVKEGTATITLPAGAFTNGSTNSTSASFKVTVTKPTAEDFSCGTVAGVNTTWTNKSVTIKVTCSGADCATSQTLNQYTPTGATTVTTKTLKVQSKSGATKDCGPYGVYYDGIAPTCKYTDSGNSSWTNKSYTVSVTCSDSGSGCKTGTLGSRSLTISTCQTSVNWPVYDNAGNMTQCGAHNVYTDYTAPTLTCTITSNNSASGVKVKRVFSDACSGLSSGEAAGVSRTLEDTYKYGLTFTATDKAGNKKTCTLDISTSKSCSSGTTLSDDKTKCWGSYYGLGTPTSFSAWNSGDGGKYVSTCTAKTKTTAESNKETSYWTCSSTNPTLCGGTSTCYVKTTYTRTITGRTCPSGTAPKTSGGSYCYNYTTPTTTYSGTIK